MNDMAFAALTRRASLATLGAVGLAELANPLFSDAKKKKKNKKKGDVNKLCKQQIPQCDTFIVAGCAEADNPAACVAAGQQCCTLLQTCDITATFTCIVSTTI